MKVSIHTERPANKTPIIAAALVIIVFAIASFAAIMLLKAQQVQTLKNDTQWFESYFSEHQSIELSEKQKAILHNSAAIVTSVSQDAGVTVTLQSVCGNGYNAYFKVNVELPDGMNAENGHLFEKENLLINDNQIYLGDTGSGCGTLEDDNPNDNRYSLLIRTIFHYYPGCDYAFNNGIVRTLHLENIKYEDESGQTKTIEGQWNFNILFHDEGKVVNLIQKPVVVQGYNYWDKKYFEAEITSFSLTELSAHCEYKPLPNSEEGMINLRPVVIMKDGRTILMGLGGGGGGGDHYEFDFQLRTPISLDEVAFVKLTDEVVLPFNQ